MWYPYWGLSAVSIVHTHYNIMCCMNNIYMASYIFIGNDKSTGVQSITAINGRSTK